MEEAIVESLLDRCVACGDSSMINLWAKKRSSDGNIFNIFRCSSCGSGFLNPRPTSAYLEGIYAFSGHGLKEPLPLNQVLENEREYPNSRVDAKRMIFKAGKMLKNRVTNKALDVGSGYGFYSAELLNAGFRVTAINPAKWENDVFEQMNKFRPIEKYIEDFKPSEKFDLVIMSQVLEHICNVEDILKKTRTLLSHDGIVVIAVPSIDSIWVKISGVRERLCFNLPEHLNYFSTRGLFRLVERTGYRILCHQNISRVPYHFLSKRLNLKNIIMRKACNELIRVTQKIPLKVIDVSGFGLCHNVWIERDGQ
jgi:SAM-dependent methyltransferase